MSNQFSLCNCNCIERFNVSAKMFDSPLEHVTEMVFFHFNPYVILFTTETPIAMKASCTWISQEKPHISPIILQNLLSKYLGMWSLLAASSVEPNDHPLPVIMRHCGKHFLTLCLPVSSPWSYFASIKAMSVDGMEGTWLEGKFQCMICATFIAGDKHTLLVVT